MPIFEYICRDCSTRFETIVTASRQPACPQCHGDALDKQWSTFAAVTGSGGSSGRGFDAGGDAAPCGACGDPRGAGSCSLN